ncbi:molybdopterin converting factor subunit 1 [Motilimonas eburnea]|uniref:molybdopterin converting factor subunit 1 n=1 Tax=Motilimonas eburnea TaxID=1737488 RepID=UPI001E3EFEB3|nr:molybdopterin converting factor subunit 1 [Motilimonas eburnea]MCE2570105.1 molybdopterin converting factor subunit 1 [Motilimonas eburnea]
MIKVVFFAKLRESLGTQAIELESTGISTVTDVLDTLHQRYPQWQSELVSTQLLVAINHEMAKLDSEVSSGDELALFPPVTGG